MTSSWRNPPSTPTSEQLAAVNELLQSIGQAPVSTLDTSNPDVSIAWNTLVSVSRDVQAEGWTFNREYHIKFTRSATPATLNYLLLADNELQVDLMDDLPNKGHRGVIRAATIAGTGQRFLYDAMLHSNTWTYDPYVDKLFYFDWETIPIPVQEYVIARACTIVSSRITGDSTQYKMLQQREDYCRAQAIQYETTQGDYNYMGMNNDLNYYRPYKPFHALNRY